MTNEEVFDYACTFLTNDYIATKIRDQEVFGVTAKQIADNLNQYRSNVSAHLNKGVKEKKLVKIDTRPVLFVPIELIINHLHSTPEKFNYSVGEFKQEFYNYQSETYEPFERLIGHSGSQATQVKQAKSAILYPPNGLHTLLTGESGTGKSLFARTMYEFGKTSQNKNETVYPFVEFNCADYYHNPQLLLSQLFGHIRGAFTGADQETVGLVEKANNGILFLDEIHRLPPEGQELLFYLMDTGKYRKLGESNSTRKANVLIIGATTEDPNDVLLKTFKRRIPFSIQLPSYKERPIKERLQIIEQLFSKEAVVTQQTFLVDASIVKTLADLDLPGNIGQLSSEIKILCARSFLENRKNTSGEVNITYDFLSGNIKNLYRKTAKTKHEFSNDLAKYNFDMIISPADPVKYQNEKILNEKTYWNLINEIKDYSSQGLSQKQLTEKMDSTVTAYYNSVLDRMYFDVLNKEEIYKIVDQEIVDFSIDLLKEIHDDLGVEITQQHILVLAFHLKFLIDRMKNKSEDLSRGENHSNDITLVSSIIDKIEQTFDIVLPTDERKFFHMLLKNMSEDNTSTRPELYILAHGNTASSIAEVCNRLLNTNYVKAIDAPLSQDIEVTYQNFVTEIKRSQPANGIMILADMGSLLNFGKMMSAETNIPSQTIPNVTTAVALDLAHIMLNRNDHVDIIYNDYLIKNQQQPAQDINQKTPAIISACSSGKGTSVAFKSSIMEMLKENDLDFIPVFAISNTDLQNKSPEFEKITKEYHIVAIVGNIPFNIGIPFFHISTILTNSKDNGFIKFIENLNITKKDHKIVTKENKTNELVDFLAKHVMYVNPLAAVKTANEFTDELFAKFKDDPTIDYQVENVDSLRMSIIIHLGFMIERIIVNKIIKFDNIDEFKVNNIHNLSVIRSCMHIIENSFEIKVHDDEICYLMVTFDSK